MKVYTDPGNPQALKFIIASDIIGQKVNVIIVCRGDCYVTLKLKNNLPTVETGNNQFVDVKTAVRGLVQNPDDKWKKWIDWETSKIQPAVLELVVARDSKQGADYSGLLKELNQAEDVLKSHRHLSDSPSADIIDACVWSSLFPVFLNETTALE